MLRPALVAATLLLMSGCREDPMATAGGSSSDAAPSFAASATGIQALALLYPNLITTMRGSGDGV